MRRSLWHSLRLHQVLQVGSTTSRRPVCCLLFAVCCLLQLRTAVHSLRTHPQLMTPAVRRRRAEPVAAPLTDHAISEPHVRSSDVLHLFPAKRAYEACIELIKNITDTVAHSGHNPYGVLSLAPCRLPAGGWCCTTRRMRRLQWYGCCRQHAHATRRLRARHGVCRHHERCWQCSRFLRTHEWVSAHWSSKARGCRSVI